MFRCETRKSSTSATKPRGSAKEEWPRSIRKQSLELSPPILRRDLLWSVFVVLPFHERLDHTMHVVNDGLNIFILRKGLNFPSQPSFKPNVLPEIFALLPVLLHTGRIVWNLSCIIELWYQLVCIWKMSLPGVLIYVLPLKWFTIKTMYDRYIIGLQMSQGYIWSRPALGLRQNNS